MGKRGKTAFNTLLVPEFLDMVGDAFFLFDYGLHFIFTNKKGVQLIGKTEKEILGKKVTEVFPEVKTKSLYVDFLKSKKFSKKPITYFSPTMKKWLSITVYPIKQGIAVCAKDITAQIVVEEKAKDSQEILNAFFENSPGGLAIYDEEMKFLKIDEESAKRIFRKHASEVIGKSLKELSPENAQAMEPIFKKVIQDNKPIIDEIGVKDKQGNMVYGMSSRFPLRFGDGKRGIGTITVDITERIQNERRKDDFIAMTSHELKTPLTTAKILIQMLQKNMENSTNITVIELIKKTEDSICDLENLVKGLLDATIVNQGRMSFKNERFILRDIVLQTVAKLQPLSRNKLIVDWGTHEYLYADKEKVSQVLNNFIINAIKYSIKSTDIIIRSKRDGNFTVVSIQDFGIGIPKDDQLHLFDRFYQAEKHNTYPGLGLGLYIAKEIISKMGGQIWLESEEGKGSIFFFRLPMYNKVNGSTPKQTIAS